MARAGKLSSVLQSDDEPPSNGETLAQTDIMRLRRSLTLYDGVGVSVGIMIGSGIFASPGVTLGRTSSPGAALLAWVAAAALVLCASFCYAELATSIPDAGGDFAYLQRAYGDVASFSFGWYNFWVGKSGSQAIIATVFSHYLVSGLFGSSFLHTSNGAIAAKLSAIALVIVLCLINCASVKESSSIINVLTVLKLLMVTSLALSAAIHVFVQDGSILSSNLRPDEAFVGSSFSGFIGGMIPALWSFDGWADLNFMAEELINPQRLLPRIIFFSIFVVTLAYLSANVAYLSILDISTIIESHSIAVEFGRGVAGRWYSVVLSLGVAFSAAGSANGSIMTGGRALYAVGRAGKAPHVVSYLNKVGSPIVALIAQMIWSIILLCIPGSNFSTLLDYFGPASWIFYALTGVGVILIRRKEPSLNRPYRLPFYPLPPIILCVLSILIVLNSLLTSPFFTFLALGFVSSAVPIFYITFKWRDGVVKDYICHFQVQEVWNPPFLDKELPHDIIGPTMNAVYSTVASADGECVIPESEQNCL